MRTNHLHELREKTPDTHYTVEERCVNCGKRLYFTIPKGQPVDKYLESHSICSYCGCELIGMQLI
jgi:rRNA maturation protein Nop10